MNSINKTDISTIKLIRILFSSLNNKRKINIISSLVLMIITAIGEFLLISTFSVFLFAIFNPVGLTGSIENNNIIIGILKYLNIEISINSISISTIFITLFTCILRLANLGYIQYLAADIGTFFTNKAFRNTIRQDYLVHASRNSGELISIISLKSNSAMDSINQYLLLISSIFMMILISIGMIYTSIKVSLFVILIITFCYTLINNLTSKRIKMNSRVLAQSQDKALRILSESLKGFREILLEGNSLFFEKIFKKADYSYRTTLFTTKFLSQFPRFFIESIMLFIISLSVTISISNKIDQSIIISIVGTFALGLQRLLPIIQTIFSSITESRLRKNSILDFLNLMNQKPELKENPTIKKRINFKNIKLKNIYFSFNKKNKYLINNINISIEKNDIVGIIGKTGSGKSTLIDIIMGLIKPDIGQIIINDKKLDFDSEKISIWRNSFSHVPQNIFLLDASVAKNIAFGLDDEDIDFKRIKYAAELASISDFIETMPFGFQSEIGENGIKLSGGQRQRLGIARALYKKSNLIILDEATSALDDSTEKEIIQSLSKINNITIIMIAHRLTTLKNCNKIIEIEKGQISNSYSSYDEMILKNK